MRIGRVAPVPQTERLERMPVKGGYLALAGAGSLLIWSGLKGKNWSQSLRDILNGKPPSSTPAANAIQGTQTAASGGTQTGMAGIWNQGSLMVLWVTAGGPPGTARNAACHAMQESSGHATVTSPNPDGGTNVGLWQLDTNGVGRGYSVSQLQNPYTNARITVKATGGGVNWSEWATPGCP